MSPTHDAFDELVAAYALGALDGEDLVRLEAHLAEGCAECARVLADYQDALIQSAAALSTAPPPQVKRALLARVGGARSVRPTRARFWPGFRWAASVAVAAGLLAAVVAVFVSARYEGRLGEMAREAAALREQVAHQREALALLQDGLTQVITLAGLSPSPNARARMIWHAREGGILVASDLPPAPRGKAYELWAIVGARPVPAGVFTVDAEGKGSLRVAALAGAPRVDQFAVTLEPAAGVAAPTGPMYLASKSPPS
jgi:anti-sigma-K factor RskA